MNSKAKKTWQKWSNEEDELLKFHWVNSDMKTLLNTFPNRNYNSLMLRAQMLKIKSKAFRSRLNGDISKLLSKTKESFYSLGFLFGDGCFTKKGDLMISQSAKEEVFFREFISLLNCDPNKIKIRNTTSGYGDLKSCNFRVGNKKIVEQLMNTFELSYAKTYNPPKNLNFLLEKDLFPYFLIGLIDADGCVWLTNKLNNSGPQIRIEMHYNWLQTLDLIKDTIKKFYGIELKTRVSNRGFAQLIFPTVDSINWIFTFVRNSFHMKSKWDKIDCYIENIYNKRHFIKP